MIQFLSKMTRLKQNNCHVKTMTGYTIEERREYMKSYMAIYRENNPDKVNEIGKKYYYSNLKASRERKRAAWHKYAEKKKKAAQESETQTNVNH